MAAGSKPNADGSITQTYSDGSSVVAWPDGSQPTRYFAPDGSEISDKSVTASATPAQPNGISVTTGGNGSAGGRQTSAAANNLAGRQFLHDVHGIAWDSINIKQPDGSYAPETADQKQKESEAGNATLGGGGILGLGGTGATTGGAVGGAIGGEAGAKAGAKIGGVLDGGTDPWTLLGAITSGGGSSGPTESLSSLPAVKDAQAFADQLQKERDALQPRQAPQAAAAPAAAPGLVDLNGIPQVSAPKINAPAPITAGTMAAPTMAAPDRIAAGAIDPTANLVDQNTAARGQQQTAVNLAQGAAEGKAPSAAEELYKEAIGRGASTQLAAAASLQGRNPGMALRAGLAGAANVNLQSSATLAAQRAQEMAQARQDFLSGAGALRSGDTTIAQGNQNEILQANMSNLSADTQTKLGNLNAQLQTLQANLQAATAAGQANLAADTQTKIANLNAQLDVAKQDAINELEASGKNATNTLSGMTTNAGNTTTTNIANQTAADDLAKANAGYAINQTQLDDILRSSYAPQIIAALGLPIDAAKQDIANAIAAHAGDQAMWGKIWETVAKIGVAASDMTLKTDIKDAPQVADDFLASLDPKTFKWKDPKDGTPGDNLGVIAQALPKRVVTRGPGGKMWISADVIGEVLAGMGRLDQRLRQTERGRRRG